MQKSLKDKQIQLSKESARLIKLQKQALKSGDYDEVERLRKKLAYSTENMFQLMDEIANT